MSLRVKATTSPRHRIPFSKVPSHFVVTSQKMVYGVELYGPMLDSVLEMANDLMGGNGIAAERAVNQVIMDENWSILPSHQKLIVELLEKA